MNVRDGYPASQFDYDNPTTVYWQANTQDARGQLTQSTQGNGTVTEWAYQPQTGRPLELLVSDPATSTLIADQSWSYDSHGNLLERQDHRLSPVLTQSFCYDNLHRVTAASFTDCTQLASPEFEYDALGNLTRRLLYLWGTPVMLDNTYGPTAASPNAGPHALSHSGNVTYSIDMTSQYDADGNVTSDNWLPRQLTWSSFDLPTVISNQNGGNYQVNLTYNARRERTQRVDNVAARTVTVIPPKTSGAQK